MKDEKCSLVIGNWYIAVFFWLVGWLIMRYDVYLPQCAFVYATPC